MDPVLTRHVEWHGLKYGLVRDAGACLLAALGQHTCTCCGGIVVVRSVAPSISLLAMLVSSSFEMQAQCMPHDSSMHANGFVGANEKLMWRFA